MIEELLWYIIGLTAASLTMLGFVPQVLKMWKTKSVKDVSLTTLLQIGIGASLWIVYGIHIQDAIVILANIVTLTTLIIAIALYLRYNRYSTKK